MSDAKKWSSTAGPIQNKRVVKALQDILMEGRSITTKTGVIGVDEHEWGSYSPCSPPRDEATKVLAELGDKYGWTITRENYTQIIEAAQAAESELRKTRPVEDKRVTAQEKAYKDDEMRQLEAQRQAKENEKKGQIQARVIELAPKYPWAVSPRDGLSEHARCAQNVRIDLGNAFPGIRFEVKSEYGRISVRWELGPTGRQVDALMSKYQSAHFDGMTDSTRHDTSVDGEAVEIILGRVNYVSTSRHIPDEIFTEVGRLLCDLQHCTFEGMYQRNLCGDGDTFDLRDHVHQVLAVTSFPEGAKIVGIYRPGDARDQFHAEMHAKHGDGWASQDRRSVLSPEELAKLEAFEAEDNSGTITHWCALKLEAPAQSVPPANLPTAASQDGRVTVRHNREKDGVEIKFAAKPSPDVLRQLKTLGWHWSMRAHCWYKRYSPGAWDFAHRMAGIAAPAAPTAAAPADAFDCAVEDQMAEQCGLVGNPG